MWAKIECIAWYYERRRAFGANAICSLRFAWRSPLLGCVNDNHLSRSASWLGDVLYVIPIHSPVEDRISLCTGVLTSIDPGVALTILDRALNIQVTYGAVMLSFLGVYLRAFPGLDA